MPLHRIQYKQKVKMKVLVAQSSLNLCSLMGCSPPGSSVHGILQARILEWVAMPFSRDQTWVSCLEGGFFTMTATREDLKRQMANALGKHPFVIDNGCCPHLHTCEPQDRILALCPLSGHRHATHIWQIADFLYRKLLKNMNELNLDYLKGGKIGSWENPWHPER